jgi:hypothetical protein
MPEFKQQVIALWEHVKEHLGEQHVRKVQSFTFREEFLSKREKAAGKLFSGETHHNCVRLQSGELQEIPLIERPIIPASMKVSVEKDWQPL